MFEQFKIFIEIYKEKIENVLKFGRYTRVKGEDKKLQEIQLRTIRNIEDALKVGQFGFNSKAPIGSRCVVSKIGNEKIVIANEHQASIIDVSSGNTIIYNESGKYIKIIDEVTTIYNDKLVLNLDIFEINANQTIFNGGTVKHDGISMDKYHIHSQNADSDGNSQVPTNPPIN